MLVLAAGTSVQARLNGELVGVLHDPAEVAALNQTLQVVCASAIIIASLTRRRAWRRTIDAVRSGALRPWEILGGLAGAYFIAMQGIASTLVGVAVFTVAVVTGQTTSALVVDRLGLGPAGKQPLSGLRIAAVILAVVAVIAPTWQRLSVAADGAVLFVVILSVAAGMASAIQLALNGRVAAYSGQPVVSAWMNFAIGALGMSIVMIVVHLLSGWQVTALPVEHLWLLIAPLFGLVFIVAAAWAVRPLGVLALALLTVAGQLLGALLMDVIAPTSGVAVNPALIIGIILALVAAGLAAFGRVRPTARA